MVNKSNIWVLYQVSVVTWFKTGGYEPPPVSGHFDDGELIVKPT
jgi:hypothetical protein